MPSGRGCAGRRSALPGSALAGTGGTCAWEKEGHSPPRKAAHDGQVADGRKETAPPVGARGWRLHRAAGVRGDGRSNCARRLRRTNTKIPSCGRDCTLWTALDGQRVQALEQPCRRPEDAAIDQCTGQPQMRRLRRGLSEGPGPREGPGAKAPCARQTTPPCPLLQTRSESLTGYLHIINVVAVDARGGHCYNLALIMLSSLYT